MNKIGYIGDWASRLLFDLYSDEIGLNKVLRFIKRRIRCLYKKWILNICLPSEDMFFGLMYLFVFFVVPIGLMYCLGFVSWDKFCSMGLIWYSLYCIVIWYFCFALSCAPYLLIGIFVAIYLKLFELASEVVIVRPLIDDSRPLIDVSDDLEKSLGISDGDFDSDSWVIFWV